MAGLHNAYQALSESRAAEIREATGGAQDSQTAKNMLEQADGALSDLRRKAEEDPGNAETLALLEIAEEQMDFVSEYMRAHIMEEPDRNGEDASSERRTLGMVKLTNVLDDMIRREQHASTG